MNDINILLLSFYETIRSIVQYSFIYFITQIEYNAFNYVSVARIEPSTSWSLVQCVTPSENDLS